MVYLLFGVKVTAFGGDMIYLHFSLASIDSGGVDGMDFHSSHFSLDLSGPTAVYDYTFPRLGS